MARWERTWYLSTKVENYVFNQGEVGASRRSPAWAFVPGHCHQVGKWEFKTMWSWDLITLLNYELKHTCSIKYDENVLRIGGILKITFRNFTHYWPGLKVTQSLLIIVWSMSSASPFRGQSCDFRSFPIHDIILGMRLSPVVLRYRDIVQINTQILKLKSFFSFKAENRKRSVLGKCIW